MMKGYSYDEEGSTNARDYYLNRDNKKVSVNGSGGLENEIEEIGDGDYVAASELLEISINNDHGVQGLATIKEEGTGSLYSFDFYNHGGRDVVYVGLLGNKVKEDSSMDALVWALNNQVDDPSSTVVFLIHIYPETKFIPTPLGMLPISQVRPEQKESHMAQERGKRRQFLQKFFEACAAKKVKVDTILIESDVEAKAILDLISICNIRKLILGTTKSNLKKLKSRKGSGTVDQILQNAPEFCEVKIICEGKEMVELQIFECPSPRTSTGSDSPKPIQSHIKDQNQDSFGCGCFKARVMQ